MITCWVQSTVYCNYSRQGTPATAGQGNKAVMFHEASSKTLAAIDPLQDRLWEAYHRAPEEGNPKLSFGLP
eukprot:7405540-Pyramimonas_sp.AAC.1